MRHRILTAVGTAVLMVSLAACGSASGESGQSAGEGGQGETQGQGDATGQSGQSGQSGQGSENQSGQSEDSSDEAEAQELTVWLMVDAKQGWSKVVKATNAALEKKHPGLEVTVQYQQWNSYLTKFEAALAGGNAPDVVEMGNTQTTKYMAAGALLDLTDSKKDFPNSSTWLDGLEKSCTYEGKLYCVPYYAGSRAVMYRTDMFKKAGIEGEPKSLAEFQTAMKKLMGTYGDNQNFSAFFFPGKYWYAAMSFVYDYGGKIAVQKDGQWQGALDSPEARKALTKLKQIVLASSRASKTGDEATQYEVVAEGHVASFYGNAWELPLVVGKDGNPKLKGKFGTFPMPSHVPGKTMPAFLGGSDLGIPAKTEVPDLAKEWISTFTSTKSQTKLVKQGGVLPNTTSLLKLYNDDKVLSAFAQAAKNTWFVPTAKNWATVEQQNVLPNMLVDIFTGKASVDEATSAASEKITTILNS